VRDAEEGGHIVEVLAESITHLSAPNSSSNAPKSIYIHVDSAHRDRLRSLQQTVEHHRGNGDALPVYLRVPDGNRLAVIRTELLAEYNEPFKTALERLLGRHSVWVE